MRRLAPDRFIFRTILAICGVLAFHGAAAVAFAQRGGVHMGGGFRGPAPVRSPMARPISPMSPVRPPLGAFGVRSFGVAPPLTRFVRTPMTLPVLGDHFTAAPLHLQVGTLGLLPAENLNLSGAFWRFRPFRPIRPIFPIFPFGPFGFGIFGVPFFGFGFPGFWPNCDLSLGWAYSCYGLPSYGNGPAPEAPFYNPFVVVPQIEPESYPEYVYAGGGVRFVQLYMKDGTVYNVIDYWVVNNQLHFKIVEQNGTQVVEHTVDFDQLDLQKTVDVNTQRGFRFVLRDEPIEQYLQDHPSGIPNETPPAPPQTAPPTAAPGQPAPPAP